MADHQRATIYAVAERAQVSIATVSRVLQGSARVAPATRERVLAAASSLDYSPDTAARSLAAKRTHVLGLVVPELAGSYYTELLAGFETAAAEHGHCVLLMIGDQHDRARLRELESRVDGVAVMNSWAFLGEEALAHLERRTALVAIAGRPTPGGIAVSTACRENAEALTTHLLEHGRTRPVFVGDPTLAWDAEHRFAGFADALTAAGLPVPQPVAVRYAGEEAARVAEQFLAGELPTDAFVCVNDEVALELHLRLRRGGVRIGTDVALTGWDDVPAARLVEPGLTTVSQPVRELGRAAATRLVERIEGGTDAAFLQLLPTTLIRRGSCGCADDPAPSGVPTGRAASAPPGDAATRP